MDNIENFSAYRHVTILLVTTYHMDDHWLVIQIFREYYILFYTFTLMNNLNFIQPSRLEQVGVYIYIYLQQAFLLKISKFYKCLYKNKAPYNKKIVSVYKNTTQKMLINEFHTESKRCAIFRFFDG